LWLEAPHDRIRILDFGLARVLDDELGFTPSGSLLGTPSFMSPEQADGSKTDARSDLFSLGSVLYLMATGQPAFPGKTITAILRAIADHTPAKPEQLQSQIPSGLSDLIVWLLEKEVNKRPTSADDVVLRVELLQKGLEAPHPIPNELPNQEEVHGINQKHVERIVTKLDLEAVPRENAGMSPLESQTTTEDYHPSKKPIIWDDNVQFSVYRPKAIRPQTWERMLVFAHLSDLPPDAPPGLPDPVEEVRRQAEQVLGSQLTDYEPRTADSTQAIPREGELTLVPSGDGLEFNPPSRRFLWWEPVHREEFRFRAAARLDGQLARGRLSVFLGGILIAEVSLAIRIDRQATTQPVETMANPDRVSRFRRIYACVASEDEPVTEQFRHYAEFLRDQFLMSQFNGRRNAFDEQCRKLIQSADVFQLYWSQNALRSTDMEHEWRYALSLHRPEFIRSLYWEEPFPTSAERSLPPPELLALGFQKIPVTTETRERPEDAEARMAMLAGGDAKAASGSLQQRGASKSHPARKLSTHPLLMLLLVGVGVVSFLAWKVGSLMTSPADLRNVAEVAARTPPPPPIDLSQLRIGPLRMNTFKVVHFRKRGETAEFLGELGTMSYTTHVDDQVRVLAAFNQPAYCYLVAYNPDGKEQLCDPDDEHTVPQLGQLLQFPQAIDEVFYLTDGVGQQVFASREPLPAYRDWRAQAGSIPWQKSEPRPVALFDGEAARPFEIDRTERGKIGTVRSLKGQEPLEQLGCYLRDHSQADIVQAIGFPVREK
jgi:protein kinase-like protein